MKKLLAAAGLTTALVTVGGVAPASATILPGHDCWLLCPSPTNPTPTPTDPVKGGSGVDAGVDITKTGGKLGLYGSGVGSLFNHGSEVLPAGTTMNVYFHNTHAHHLDIHANTLFAGSGAKAVKTGMHSWKVTTTKPLYPGQKVDYKWNVYHYGFWHRVTGHAELEQIPGLKDVNPANDHDVEDNGGIGF